MFRAWAASPGTYAAKAPFASSPPSSPILLNAPCFSFLSHNPENAFFFLLVFKSRLIVPGRMGRASDRTMQMPFSQDVRWSSQGRKMLTVGFPQQAALGSSHSLPLPSRLSCWTWLSDYQPPLVGTHLGQLKCCASCTASCEIPWIVNTHQDLSLLFLDLHPTRCWKSNSITSKTLCPSLLMTAASILNDITCVDTGAVNECRSPFIACQPLSMGMHRTPGHPELGARTGFHLLSSLWNKGISGCATPTPSLSSANDIKWTYKISY